MSRYATLTYRVDTANNCAYVKKCNFDGDIAVIADEYNGYPVTGVDDYAFNLGEKPVTYLHTIIFGDNIEYVNFNFYNNCDSLIRIKLGKSCLGIGSTFDDCANICDIWNTSNLYITPDSDPDTCGGINKKVKYISRTGFATEAKTIGDYEAILQPDGVCMLTHYYGNGGNITIPNEITRINPFVFTELIDETGISALSFTDNITYVSDYAFYHTETIEESSVRPSITINKNIEHINFARHGLDSSWGLVFDTVTVPENAKCNLDLNVRAKHIIFNNTYDNITANRYIGWSEYTETIVLPEGVTKIADYAFNKYTKLTDITLPSSLTVLEECCFYDCTSLTNIALPSEVKIIGYRAFYGCNNLSIQYSGNKLETLYISGSSCTWNLNLTANLDYLNHYFGDSSNTVIFSGVTEQELYLETDSGIPGGSKSTGLTKLTLHGLDSNKDNNSYWCEFYGNTQTLEYIDLSDCKATDWYFNFSGNTSLKTCILPVNALEIRYQAFINCANLNTVVLSANLKTIGDRVFHNCGLNSISIPGTVTTMGKEIFGSCSKLKSIEFKEGITAIDRYTCYYCTSLESVILPATLTRIEDYAFYGCTSLNNLTLPVDLKYIGYRTFAGCTNLSVITFNESLNFVEYAAFDNTIWLENQPSGEIIIGSCLYDYKGTMPTSYTMSDTITTANREIFCGNRTTSIVLSNNLQHWAKGTSFSDPKWASGLSFTTYENGKYLGSSTNPYYCLADLVDYEVSTFTTHPDTVIIDPYLTKSAGLGTSINNLTITDNVVNMPDLNFYSNFSALTTLTAPDLPQMTKSYPANLESVTLTNYTGEAIKYESDDLGFPRSIKNININTNIVISIPSSSFCYNTNLQTASFTGTFNSILKYAFFSCTSLTAIVLPNSITSIGYGAFQNCSALININMPSSMINIEEGAFEGCSNLASTIVIPKSVSSIARRAFYNCSSLENLTFEDGGTSPLDIGEYAFYGSNILKGAAKSSELDIILPSNIRSIGAYAFADNKCISGWTGEWGIRLTGTNMLETLEDNCVAVTASYSLRYSLITFAHSSITNLVLPKIKYIGENTFNNPIEEYWPAKIISVDFTGAPIEIIPVNCFKNQYNLQTVVLPAATKGIESGAFYNCKALSSINLPETLEYIAGFGGQINEIQLTSAYFPNLVRANSGLAKFKAESVTASRPLDINANSFTLLADENYTDFYIDSISNELQTLILPNTIKNIKRNSIGGSVNSLINIVLPSNLESIGEYGLAYTSLTNISLPASLKFIDKYAFYQNPKLESISFATNFPMKYLPTRAFEACPKLATINIPNSILELGSHAFASCSSLTTLSLANISIIHECAFAGCSKLCLNNLVIPNKIKCIYDCTFSKVTIENLYINTSYLTLQGINDNEFIYLDPKAFAESKINNLTISNTIETLPATNLPFTGSTITNLYASNTTTDISDLGGSTVTNLYFDGNAITYQDITKGALNPENIIFSEQLYKTFAKNGEALQVQSAIRDGEGRNIKNTYLKKDTSEESYPYSTATDLSTFITDFNNLLAYLRERGFLKDEE